MESFYYNKRLLYIISRNANIDQGSINDMKTIIWKTSRVSISILVGNSLSFLYCYNKGYIKFKGSSQVMEAIKFAYGLLFSGLFLGSIPTFYYYRKLTEKMNEILITEKEKGVFSEHELRLLYDEKYFEKKLFERIKS